MSEVESAIDRLLSKLRNLSSSYRSSATNLIQAADQATQQLKTPDSKDLDFKVTRTSAGIERVPIPPSTPNLTELNLPEQGDLQSLSGIEDRFTAKAPSLSWPNFSYGSIAPPNDFTQTAPSPAPLTVKVTVPPVTAFSPPTLTTPTEITVEALGMKPPTADPLVFADVDEDLKDVLTRYQGQVGSLLEELAPWREWLSQAQANVQILENRVTSSLASILTGKSTALPDIWETQTYQQAQHEAFNQRYAVLESLDTLPGSITGLPSGSRDYPRLKAELQTTQTLAQAAAKTALARQQQEVRHLRWALELAAQWGEATSGIYADAQAWKLQGVNIIVEGAQATLDAAIKVLEFKSKELTLLLRYNELQLRSTEDWIKVERTKLENLQLQIENNKLKNEYNQHQAQIDAAATTYVEAVISLFESQITYLLADQEWRKISYAGFEAEIAAYQSRVQAVRSEHTALKARMNGDMAEAEAELAKAKQYTLALQAQESNAQALLAKTKLSAERVQQVLTGYNTEVSAKIDWLTKLDRATSVAIQALVKEFDAETRVEQIKIAQQELNDQDAIHTEWRNVKADQLELLKTLYLHSIYLKQAEEKGKIMAQGANTLGSLAQAAFSGLNAIGTQSIIEEA